MNANDAVQTSYHPGAYRGARRARSAMVSSLRWLSSTPASAPDTILALMEAGFY